MPTKKWNDIAEKGGPIYFKIMFFIYQRGGRKLFDIILSGVIFWYWLFAPLARRSSSQYLNHLYHYFQSPAVFKQKPNFFASYKHLYAFGGTLLEKMFGWFGEITENDIKIFGGDIFKKHYNQGAVIIVSHFGNFEIIRAIRANRQKINVLVYHKHAEAYNQVLSQYSAENSINLISIEQIGIAEALILKEKVDQGEWVLIAADRVPVNSRRVISVDFLGEAANWSIGPWLLAHLLECPVITLFSFFNQQQYEIHLGEMYRTIDYSRENRDVVIKQTITDYVKILEQHCRNHPFLWFNFFDFWQSEKNSSKA